MNYKKEIKDDTTEDKATKWLGHVWVGKISYNQIIIGMEIKWKEGKRQTMMKVAESSVRRPN